MDRSVLRFVLTLDQSPKGRGGIPSARNDLSEQKLGVVMVFSPRPSAERTAASGVGCRNARQYREGSRDASQGRIGLVVDEVRVFSDSPRCIVQEVVSRNPGKDDGVPLYTFQDLCVLEH